MDAALGDLFDLDTVLVPVDRASHVSVSLGAAAPLSLEQNEGGVAETGGLVWSAGVELAQWLAAHQAALDAAAFAAIVDLGCGSGVGALAAATLLPRVPRVLFCDFDATALALAERNALRNGVASARCEFVRRSMLECDRVRLGLDDEARVLVLASDVCYDNASEQALDAALAALLAGPARGVLALQQRGDLLTRFAAALPARAADWHCTLDVSERLVVGGARVALFDLCRGID